MKLSVGLILYYIYAYLGLEELNLDLSGWVSGGWVAGLIENITNSAKLKLELELSLAKKGSGVYILA